MKNGVHELRRQIRAARAGGQRGPFPPELRHRLQAHLRRRWEEGESLRDLAAELGLSDHTVQYWRGHTLQALVEGEMKGELATGDLFVFVAKNRTRAKLLYFDGTDLCLFCKRLETGKFAAPWSGPFSKRLELTMNELSLFIEGSEALGRIPLSPPLLRKADLRTKVFEKKVS